MKAIRMVAAIESGRKCEFVCDKEIDKHLAATITDVANMPQPAIEYSQAIQYQNNADDQIVHLKVAQITQHAAGQSL